MKFRTRQPIAFRSAFGTERQCRRFLFRRKWPDGFECPRCRHRGAIERNGGRRWVCGRRGCSYWESPTKGTIAESIKKPLRVWFWGLWLFAHSPGGITAARMKEELGFGSYQTAWTWCHKFRAAIQDDPELGSAVANIQESLNKEGLQSPGIHGWRGMRKGLLAHLGLSSHRSGFKSWTLSLNSGRSSAKHGKAYVAEHEFWRVFNSPEKRWRSIRNHLSMASIPYWQLVRRVGPMTALALGMHQAGLGVGHHHPRRT